jgi:hypothetical protein
MARHLEQRIAKIIPVWRAEGQRRIEEWKNLGTSESRRLHADSLGQFVS